MRGASARATSKRLSTLSCSAAWGTQGVAGRGKARRGFRPLFRAGVRRGATGTGFARASAQSWSSCDPQG